MWMFLLAALSGAGTVPVVPDDGATTSGEVGSHRLWSWLGPHGSGAVHRPIAGVEPSGWAPSSAGRPRSAAPGTAALLQSAGPPADRLDLVLIGDGYTEAELGDFAADADRIVAHLRTLEPWASYTGLLNIWRVDLASPSSGVSHDELGTTVDTALGCAYGCEGIDRLVCCDDAVVLDTVAARVPGAEGVLVLVNDDTPGGGGSFAYATSSVGADAPSIAVHELSHSLAGLWDEYDYGIEGVGRGPNCSPDADVQWTEWLDEPGVGAHVGCSFSSHLRPTEVGCLMRTLTDDYCVVCRERIVRALYEQVPSLVVAADPPVGEVVLDGTVGAEPVVDGLSMTWTLDGEPVGDGPAWAIPEGAEGRLMLEIRDDTPFVRADPDGLLEERVGPWHVGGPPDEEGCGCAHGTAAPWLLLPVLIALRPRRRSC